MLLAPLLPAFQKEPASRSTSPVHSGYLLGPHDQVRIRAVHAEEISSEPFRIDPDGYLDMPLVGRVRAAGLTVQALEQLLCERLKEYVLEPAVSINLVAFRNQPVSVIGAVKAPGVHQLQEPKRLVEIISLAGGLSENAGTKLRITRQLQWGRLPIPGASDDPTGQFSMAEIDLDTLIRASNPAENIYIQPHDVISVPRAEVVYVIGEVKKAGGFTLRDQETVHVLQVLAMAEGLQPTAGPKHAKIMRVSSAKDGERQEIPVNIRRIMEGRDPDVSMRPDDILVVPNNAARSVALRSAEAALQIATGLVVWRR